jgi:hypothetical protein
MIVRVEEFGGYDLRQMTKMSPSLSGCRCWTRRRRQAARSSPGCSIGMPTMGINRVVMMRCFRDSDGEPSCVLRRAHDRIRDDGVQAERLDARCQGGVGRVSAQSSWRYRDTAGRRRRRKLQARPRSMRSSGP